LENEGGTLDAWEEPRADLPPIAKQIPNKPPKDFPEFDPSKPDDTDFQLQQALVVARAMSTKQDPPGRSAPSLSSTSRPRPDGRDAEGRDAIHRGLPGTRAGV
jgi:carboxyl-terminal processing protease